MNKTIKIDGGFGFGFDKEFHDNDTLVRRARELEEIGYDGLPVAEMCHDLFLPLAMAALHTKRFSMPWHGPAKQMREHIEAMQAIATGTA